jgi:ArsR family transcriptional regulator
VDEAQVEATMLEMVGGEPIGAMLDLGTGTGRMLELFSHLYERGMGIDASRDMLSVARSRLDDANLSRVQTRQGDMYLLPTQAGVYDLVTIHQVLHYLDNPAAAIQEASKALREGGRLMIVDFAPHELEFLRTDHAHLRLGFSRPHMHEWLKEAGLKPVDFKSLQSSAEKSQAKENLTVSLWLAQK